MGTPLYNTDIIPLTSRPTLTVMDDGDYFIILDTSTGKISKILKTNIMIALKITYDNTSGLTAETVQAALDELVVNLGSIDDAVSTLAEVVDTNRLYSDSQYLDLKAKYDAQQIALNASKAELYTDDPILQYGAVEIIGDGYEADDTPIDVSANVVDGKMDIEQKGLTIRNLVKNGDFSQGTTGWTGIRTGLSVTNKILSATATGTASYNMVHILDNLVIGESYFVSLRVRVTNDKCIRIELSNSGSGYRYPYRIETPIINQWYVIEYQFVATQTSISLFVDYNTSAGALNSVVQIDGNYGVSAYNLTSLGLDHITDTAILSKLLPYVDGTQNVGKMGMQIVYDNLWWFDFTSLRTESKVSILSNSNHIEVKATENGDWNSARDGNIFYPFGLLGKQITLSCDMNKVVDNSGNPPAVRASLAGSSLGIDEIGVAYNNQPLTFVVTQNIIDRGIGLIIYPSYPTAISGDTAIFSNLMLNLGSTALPYEPYQEQLTFLPSIGNSLPNGVADSVKTTADGWEHTKRVERYVLQSADIEGYSSTNNFVYTKHRTESSFLLGAKQFDVGTLYIPTKEELAYQEYSKSGYYYSGNRIYFTNYTSFAEAEADLVGTVIYYQLATPIITHYDFPHLTSGKTIHRFAGEEKIALYGTGIEFSENVLSVLSAVKFVAGVMTDITSLATITGDTVTFSGVNATDVVYVKVEHDVDRPLGVLEHTPAVSNTASRLAALEAAVFGG